MENSDASKADSKEIARLLADWYRNNKLSDWEKPKPKNKNYIKVKRIKAVLTNGD